MIIPCESCNSLFRLEDRVIRPTGSKVRCSNCGKIFKVFRPNGVEKRKHHRIKTQNLISYFSLDKTGKMISHGMGIAMDLSLGGILLQTAEAIDSNIVALSATDRKKSIIEVKGKLAYSKKTSIGTYFSGIKFIGLEMQVKKFIVNLIKEYNYHGYNLYIRSHSQEPPPIPHNVA